MPLDVALVVPEYRTHPGGGGGLATVADFLRAAFAEAGWSVTVYTPRMSRRASESRRLVAPRTWLRALKLHHRPDHVVAVGSHLAEVEGMRYLPRKVLDQALCEAQVIVLVAGSPAIAHIARRCRVPIVLQVATLISAERKQLLQSQGSIRGFISRATAFIVAKMDQSAIRIPDVVITENQWMTEQCKAMGARTVELAPPGVDTQVFRPPEEGARRGGYLLMVSRLGDPRKDVPTLLRAYAEARARGVRIPLVLAGRGRPTQAELALAAELGLRDFVSIRNDVPEDELVDLLQHADLFVMSSSEEGLGIVLLEAMACGLPILSTATQGAQFAVGNSGAGELVAIGDYRALAEGILAWMTSAERRLEAGKVARVRAAETFSMGAAGSEFIRIIGAAVADRAEDRG